MKNGRSVVWHGTWAIVVSCLITRHASAQSAATTGKQKDAPVGTTVRNAKVVTLALENVTVREALYAVAHDAGLAVSFNGGDSVLKARLAARITTHFDNVPLADALAQVMRGTGYGARLSDDGTAVMIVRASGHRTKEKRVGGVITGRAVDSASGRGLSGATVSVQGMRETAMANSDGQFTLRDIPAGAYTVTVRLFGYRPATRAVTVTDSIPVVLRVALAPAPNILSGVVTTATGKQRKVEIGNSIPTLNVDSIMRVAPVTSLADLLEARVPGVQVTRSSGTPGDPTRIRIRGVASINRNNDPIVIVDGIRIYAAQSDARNANQAGTAFSRADGKFDLTGGYAAPSPIDQIDPNTIETIEIFKGPSATAQWGSDAANGVIVITTKKGRAGPTHVRVTAEHGWTYMPGRYPENIARWGHLFNGASTQYSLANPFARGYTLDSITHYQVLNDPRFTVLGHGSRNGVSTTVSGGSQMLTYSLTGSATGDIGILKLPGIEADRFRKFHGSDPPGWMTRPDKYSTWSGGGMITMQPSANASIAYSGRLFRSAQQRSSLDNALSALMSLYVDTTQLAQTPLISQFYERARSNQWTIDNAVNPQWKPFSWLPLTGTLGLSIQLKDDDALLPRGYYVTPSAPLDSLGRYGITHGRAITKTGEIYTGIPSSLRVGQLTTSLGFNVTQVSINDLISITDSLAVGETQPVTFNNPTTTLNTVSTTTYGWFFEPRLNLKSRFFLTPGFRLDGGNASGDRARVSGLPAGLNFSSLFPKVNFSWLASDEPWFPAKGSVSLLQIKGSFGHAGVQPSPGDKLRTYADDIPRVLDGTLTDNLAMLRGLGNTELRPERSTELEGGFVLGLWDDRAQIDFTRYHKRRVDAIIQVPVAPSVGGGSNIMLNVGEVLNTGTELTVNVEPIRTRPLGWVLNLGFASNNNVVQRLAPGVASIPSNSSSRIVAGYPLFSRWALPIISYADADGNGVISADEVRIGDSLVYVGREEPKYTMDGSTTVTLFNSRVMVNAAFAYINGQTQFNDGGAGMLSQLVNDPSISPAQQAAFMAINGNRSTTYGLIQTVHSFRVQSLSVNYAVPQSWSRRLRVPTMSVALQGSNLGLWTNYRGKDPNVNALSTGNEIGDTGQLPQPRKWQVQVSFAN